MDAAQPNDDRQTDTPRLPVAAARDATSEDEPQRAAPTPDEIREEIERLPAQTRVQIAAQLNLFPGMLLPPPSVLREYEDIVPGSAKTLIGLVAKQTEHRHGLEKTVVDRETNRSYVGLVGGVILGVIGLAFAAYCVHEGQSAFGIAIVLFELASFVGVFVYGTRSRREERIAKTRIMTESAAPPGPDEAPDSN